VHVSVPTIEWYDKDVHVAVQKSGVCKMLYCLKKKNRQGCIYLIKNYSKNHNTLKYIYNLK